MNIPETWPTLNDFTQWYKDNNYPIRMPHDAYVYPTDVSYSVCVFRQDVYQAEMYLARPYFMSTRHSHPFEQQIIFVGGDLVGRRGFGDQVSPISSLLPSEGGMVGGVLPPQHWHEVGSGEHGFVFFNCQKWPNKEMMTSAVVEYNGPSLGEMHNDIKNS